jgi:hypothetical protein
MLKYDRVQSSIRYQNKYEYPRQVASLQTPILEIINKETDFSERTVFKLEKMISMINRHAVPCCSCDQLLNKNAPVYSDKNGTINICKRCVTFRTHVDLGYPPVNHSVNEEDLTTGPVVEKVNLVRNRYFLCNPPLLRLMF